MDVHSQPSAPVCLERVAKEQQEYLDPECLFLEDTVMLVKVELVNDAEAVIVHVIKHDLLSELLCEV